MLYYTNSQKYCGKEANLQVTVVLCLPTLMGQFSPGHGSLWAKAGPGGNLQEQRSQQKFFWWSRQSPDDLVKKDNKEWKNDGRFDPG